MSHDHELECRACGSLSGSPGSGGARSCYAKFKSWYGDGLIENAPAIVELVKQGIEFDEGQGWAVFVSEHAHCNAFYEVCENARYGNSGCDGYPRRILVKGASDPVCERCMGRRLVACPDCSVGPGSRQVGVEGAPE